MIRTLIPSILISLVAACRIFAAEHPTLPIGSPLPDFKLRGVDDREYTPRDFAKADILVVVFTSNHCPTAQLYEERLKQLVSDFKSRNVAFVAINPNHPPAVRLDEMAWTDLDDTFGAMKVRAQHRGYNFPYLDDGTTQVVTEKFGAIATPHIFIFDRDRRLRFQGRIDDSERPDLVKEQTAREAITALLAGQAPPITTTKVFGCSIKWRDKADENTRWLAKVAKEPVELARANVADLKKLRANEGTGKIRLLAVWSTNDEASKAQLDELVAHHLRFRNREMEVVTVAAQSPEDEATVREVLKQHHASMSNFILGSADRQPLLKALDPEWTGQLPHVVLLSHEGKVIYRQTGPTDFLALRRALLPALDVHAPWPASGK